MALVVSDTSAIRALSFVGYLDLLAALFDKVLIPPAVLAELNDASQLKTGFVVEAFPFMRVQAPANRNQVISLMEWLDAGESEAIALALEIRTTSILMDEADGREAAIRVGLQPVGALGILLRGKEIGRIERLAPLLDRLDRELGFYMLAGLQAQVLKLAGE